MPTSQKQITANRANAQKSTGPKTDEGKAISRQNGLRHGVTAQTTVMTDEDRLHHDAFCAEMLHDLFPVGSMEIFLASSVAEEAWRLNYSRAACNNIVAIGHFDGTGDRFSPEHPEVHTAITAASAILDHAKQLELLSLYEQRIHNSMRKHFEQLRKLQGERTAAHSTDLEEARLFSQLSKLQHLPYIPAFDGFGFSNDEIDRHTERHHRLRLAQQGEIAYRIQFGLCDLPKAA